MQIILGLILLSLPILALMGIYYALFKAKESVETRLRGEHKVKSPATLLDDYQSFSTLEIEADFLDRSGQKTQAKIPAQFTHALVMGRSGSGKSTLVEALARAILGRKKDNLVVIEPHLSLCERLARWGTEAGREVIFVDLALSGGQITPWNPLWGEKGQRPEEVASFLMGCFDDRFNVFSTPQQAETLRAGFTLLAENNLTLDYFPDIFFHGEKRRELLENSTSRFCRQYFGRFEELSDSKKESKLLPALNKIALLLQDRASRLILCSKKQGISLSEIINTPGTMLLICLNRGANPTVSDLVGSLFLSALKNAVFLRKPDSKETPFVHFFCDEFPAFVSPNVGSVILAESRKYRINAVFISQFLQIQDPRFKQELLQNTSLQFLFNLESKDAYYFEKKLSRKKEIDLSQLPPFEGYLLDKNQRRHIKFSTRPLRSSQRSPILTNTVDLQEAEETLRERFSEKGLKPHDIPKEELSEPARDFFEEFKRKD